jgi:hypothetical protein
VKTINPLLDPKMKALAEALMERSRELTRDNIPLGVDDGMIEANSLGCAAASIMAAKREAGDESDDLVSTAFALALGSHLEHQFCCLPHMLQTASDIMQRALQYATDGVQEGPPSGETCH